MISFGESFQLVERDADQLPDARGFEVTLSDKAVDGPSRDPEFQGGSFTSYK